jgi:tetratricopeptide (TPR) repeat protein
MRTLICVAALLSAVVAQESRSSAHSRPSVFSKLVASGRGMLGIESADDAAANEVMQRGFEHKTAGRHDQALECFARLGRDWPETYGGLAWQLVVATHVDRGDFDAAVTTAEAVLDGEADEDRRNLVVLTLATVHERRGDWRKALEAAERGKPLEDPWSFFSPMARDVVRARCRFHLGEVDVALKLLEKNLETGRVSDTWRCVVSDTAAAYAEFAGRSGRIAAARTFAAKLPSERRDLVLGSLRAVEAWIAKDPAALMRSVGEGRFDASQTQAATRLLIELGPPALKALAGGVAAGDVVAIRLAGASGRIELLPALEERRRIAASDAAEALEAIDNLQYAASRPASRPTTRPAK